MADPLRTISLIFLSGKCALPGASPPFACQTAIACLMFAIREDHGENGRLTAGAPVRVCVYVRARPSKCAQIHPQIMNVRREEKAAPIFPDRANRRWKQVTKKSFFDQKERKKSQEKDPSGEMRKRLRRERKKAAAPAEFKERPQKLRRLQAAERSLTGGWQSSSALEHCMQTPRLSLFLCSQCACVC